MPHIQLSSTVHYIRFSVQPSTVDVLTMRKALQISMMQAFGDTSSNTYLDVLWVSEDGSETVIRTSQREATKLMAAIVLSTATPKFSLIKESPFLPSLLSSIVTL
ncbi:hypothetical protein SERLADRAFT_352146 [Serpula lacrymans var. lacrymans S7.9]|uniref:Uncharacterized protein n=1 Tax=Serpula lacrymans var. lacrymans (strain S7.9) TaxID=578457 RepID=F8P8Z6_SERL9|nr:uncharacterized protein SERLADRAFT_352146 [Serpula lacrymans var. lacrymans S7.9]EGO20125.1 hypothetical protein SERLADRAFT_352146 [Serpula lacrymans var. lacrymans S7.9]